MVEKGTYLDKILSPFEVEISWKFNFEVTVIT